jgi:hypothetical protein
MNKHKKTRQEKVISDLRKKLASQKETNPSTSLPIINKTAQTNNQNSSSTYTLPTIQTTHVATSFSKPQVSFDYSYVYRDLRKTLFLTILIVGVEFFIYFVWH